MQVVGGSARGSGARQVYRGVGGTQVLQQAIDADGGVCVKAS